MYYSLSHNESYKDCFLFLFHFYINQIDHLLPNQNARIISKSTKLFWNFAIYIAQIHTRQLTTAGERRLMESFVILPDNLALEQIKMSSRASYQKAFNRFREYVGRDLEDSGPVEEELLNYFRDLRNEQNAASSTLWTTYSMINTMCKGKYNSDLKKFTRVRINVT